MSLYYLCIQHILGLNGVHAERDVQCVADANQFFNGHLGHTDANGAFTYTSKSGASVVMTKVGDITRNWRSLFGV
jgi:glutamine amidotransferase-like uncharacterized protein